MNSRSKKIDQEKYWIYGKHAVRAALLNNNRKCYSLLATTNCYKEIENLVKLRSKIAVSIVDSRVMDAKFTTSVSHQNIALEVENLVNITLDDLLIAGSDKSVILALDQLTDPHNIGAILRSAAAFNVDAVLITQHHSPKDVSTIAKISSGALELVPLIKIINLSHSLNLLKKSGYWVVGLDGQAENNLDQVNLSGKIVFVLGSEGNGLRRLTRENCDILAKLPINEAIESLNVSNAAAIAVYEYQKHNVCKIKV